MYGQGIYTLSSVMYIDGTEEYIKIAEENGKCQNKESQESCLAREYLTKGLKQCSCIPFNFRNYLKQVGEKMTLDILVSRSPIPAQTQLNSI